MKFYLQAAIFALLVGLVGCESRGSLALLQQASFTPDQITQATLHQMLAVTSRKPSADSTQDFSGERAQVLSYRDYTVSVPPIHETGQIEWAKRNPDVAKNFVTIGTNKYSNSSEFLRVLNARLNLLSPGKREVAVFVHGYNTNFSEGLYRFTQMVHDYDVPSVPVYYSWPSGAKVGEYVYDRDSAAFARDDYVKLLGLIAQSNAERIVLMAHSLGSFLTVETLRQISISGRKDISNKIGGTVLISPDIDAQLFIRQLSKINPKPNPFVVVTSNDDRALRISSILSGKNERLGQIQDVEKLKGLGIIVIDLSDIDDGDSLQHMKAATSPAAIAFLKGIRNVREKIGVGFGDESTTSRRIVFQEGLDQQAIEARIDGQ